MTYSDDYIRQIGKRSEKGEIKVKEVRKLLFDFLNAVPEDLQWDIFNLFFPGAEDDELLKKDAAERLSEVIDLFEGEYDEDDLKLSDEELRYISEGVNDFALELTDECLTNVMRAAVSRGLMG